MVALRVHFSKVYFTGCHVCMETSVNLKYLALILDSAYTDDKHNI